MKVRADKSHRNSPAIPRKAFLHKALVTGTGLLLSRVIPGPLDFSLQARNSDRSDSRARGSSHTGKNESSTNTYDVLIRNATILDGTGGDPYRADVALRHGRISRIAKRIREKAYRTLDARGLTLTPGFIDIHSHSDITLLKNGLAHSKILQGVTLEVVGQDGRSVAPLNEEMVDRFVSLYGTRPIWRDFSGYYRALLMSGVSVNVMSMVGAGTLRDYVIGRERRAASSSEKARMGAIFKKAVEQGVHHMSSGLEYIPGSYATAHELTRIVRPGKLYSTHMRSEDDRVIQALEEAIQIARKGNVALNISHMKAQGAINHHRLPAMIEMMDQARSGSFAVTCDRYPFEAYSSRLITLIPGWARDEGEAGVERRLKNPHTDLQIRIGVEKKIRSIGSWEDVMLSSVRSGRYRHLQAGRLLEGARRMGLEPYELYRELILAGEGSSPMVVFAMARDNLRVLMQYEFCAIASDGAAFRAQGNWSPHPRNFGTFPEVLERFVNEERLISPQEAIRKMTGLPAAILGLTDRGLIREGNHADLLLLRLDRVSNRSTYASPLHYPEGIPYVFVNGQMVVDSGEHTGLKPGRIVRA